MGTDTGNGRGNVCEGSHWLRVRAAKEKRRHVRT